MKSFLINFVCSSLVIVLVWLVTFNNHFAFGWFTPFMFLFFMFAYYWLTTEFHWLITSLNFIISLLITSILIDFLAAKFQNWNLLDEESFPNASYFVLSAVIWVICKLSFDVFLKIIIPKPKIRITGIEKLWSGK